MDKFIYGTLGDSITPDYVRDVNDLEQKRREILKEAKRVKKMGEKLDGNIAKAQDSLNVQETWRRSTLLSSRSR
jgi:hypothetical protein